MLVLSCAVVLDCEDEEQWRTHDELWTKALPALHWTTVAVARGEKLSMETLWAAQGVLLTGSHHCATDASLPWRAMLVDAMQQLVQGPVPPGMTRPQIVGVCFGCQLLADCLGGSAGPNPDSSFVLGCEEWRPCTSAGCSHGPCAALRTAAQGTALRIIETHGDCVVELPACAHVLCSSDSCSNELFSLAPNGTSLVRTLCTAETSSASAYFCSTWDARTSRVPS